MASQPEVQKFQSAWTQTASWAQSKGIKYNDYFPIYQQDTQRLLQYGTPMSQAERERAITAAANPQEATQTTPSTASNPANVIGNTITDARNIFTGIGGIAIHPLHNGLVDSIKNTFDLIDGSHKLTGGNLGAKLGNDLTSTVLSWIPGVADVGSFLTAEFGPGGHPSSDMGGAGLTALADHPLQTVFDILPLAKPLALVKDPATAARFGATNVAAANRLGPLRTLKGYVMSTKTNKIGPTASDPLAKMTVGDVFHQWTGGTVLNLNPQIADAAGGYEQILNHGTQVNRAMLSDLTTATQGLRDHQIEQVKDVVQKSEQVGMDKAMEEVEDPAVIKVLDAWMERNQWETEEAINAVDGPRIITNIRNGQKGLYSVGGHSAVISARDAAQAAEESVLAQMPNAQKLVEQTQAAGQFLDQSVEKLTQANSAAREVTLKGNYAIKMPGGSKRFPTPFSRDKIAKEIVDTGGRVDRLLEKARMGEYETVAQDSLNTLNRLNKWGVDRINVEELPPEFKAVRDQVAQLHKAARAILHARKVGSKAVHGKAEQWIGQKPFRDARHQQEVKALETSQRIDRTKLAAVQRNQVTHLRKAFSLKRSEITKRYTKARSDREHTLADGIKNINDRYALEKTKLTTRHLLVREAHQEWMRGRRAQGLPASTEFIQGLQEGTRVSPGGLGTQEAIQAGTGTLEAARRQEIGDLEASLPSKTELVAKQQAEMNAAKLTENQMVKRLEAVQASDERDLLQKQQQAKDMLKAEHMGKLGREGPLSQAIDEYMRTMNEFSNALYRNPSDNLQPLFFKMFSRNLVEDERARGSIAYKQKILRDRGYTQEHLDNLHSNPETMRTLIQLGLKESYDDPIFDDLDKALVASAAESAYKNLDEMMRTPGVGIPQWVHHVSPTQIKNDELGSAGIRLIVGKGIPKPNVLKPRPWGLDSSKFDVMAAVTHPQRQFLERAAMKEYVSTYLDKRIVTERDALDMVITHFPDEVSGGTASVLALFEEKMADWGLVAFDPADHFGFKLARWGEGKTYIDRDLLHAVEKLSNTAPAFRGGKLITKTTKLFRYSILGLSPRYTAHIVFGGTFLLALKEPLFFVHIPEMLTRMKNGQLDEDLYNTPVSNMGTTDWALMSKQKKLDAWHTKGGEDSVHYMGQEHIETKQGIKWQNASPLHWAKALADINLHFTTTVTHMQRGVAYLAGAARAERKGYFYDDAGNKLEMTQSRMAYEGMKNAASVFGDLRRMSPFERNVARTVMPFYGWQKHILQYVFTFPGDHPWRTMMLANMAEYDTSHTPGGLPSRYQFLFMLGHPDAQGNVTAIDTRALNPLRDTANYATWQGLIAGLNPVMTAPLAAINPQIIYGSNTLYPKLTYDQFYGIKEAGPQGNLLTAAQQVVPQIGAMQNALKIAGQRQGMNDSQLLKSIGNQLNFPWIPQQLNLKQEAARTSIAQYQVTKQLATDAWNTGDFSQIQDLGSVPDPRNADYETPVSDLQALYDQLAKQYPGIPPSSSAQPLPAL
ncbi:MAG: hypothetical protein OK436_02850, partial [Thaumarchaeota archaeon]|nr:hypothetical protein [Nitrososphaerota archaeon]